MKLLTLLNILVFNYKQYLIILEIRTEKYKNDGDRFYLFNFSASQRMSSGRLNIFIPPRPRILNRRFQFSTNGRTNQRTKVPPEPTDGRTNLAEPRGS